MRIIRKKKKKNNKIKNILFLIIIKMVSAIYKYMAEAYFLLEQEIIELIKM